MHSVDLCRHSFHVWATLALLGCSGAAPHASASAAIELVARAHVTSLFGPPSDFTGSELEDIGRSGLFPVRTPEQCEVAVLAGGEDSLSVRLALLKSARSSIRIQALIFTADESGLRVTEVLKQKQREGVNVRVIVDALSNSSLQTQWMYFDLKQHGIEVEGYEALALQWLQEVPVLMPHADAEQPNKRFHEKLWIVDGDRDHGVAVTGGLNIGNEYFRVDPSNPDRYWRDQDVIVRGQIVADLVTAFDRNFKYFVEIKQGRGVFNTNLYWDAMRAVVNKIGKVPMLHSTQSRLEQTVAEFEARRPARAFYSATCRFLQSRPRLRESYIQQAYLKLIAGAKREVLIANAYFVPTSSTLAALADAARRCVSVVLMCNSPETNDTPGISPVGRGYYKRLLAVNDSPAVRACAGSADAPAGIQLWEWRGRRAEEPTRGQGLMHSKFAVADRRISLVGSHNLDPRSERLNSESAIVFESPQLAEQLATAFLQRDLSFSRRISAKEAATFESPESAMQRFKKQLGHLFEEHL
jgi:cardiolipin synthase C